MCVCVLSRSYVGNDSSLTDKETVMLVEEVVLLIAFGITEIKRLIFIDSMCDSIKVSVCDSETVTPTDSQKPNDFL